MILTISTMKNKMIINMNNDYERYNFWQLELKSIQPEKTEQPLQEPQKIEEIDLVTTEQNT